MSLLLSCKEKAELLEKAIKLTFITVFKRNNNSKNSYESIENAGVNKKKKSKLKHHKCQGYGMGNFRNECLNKVKYVNSKASEKAHNDEAFVCESFSCEECNSWIADCRATDRVTHHHEYFPTYEKVEEPGEIYVVDNNMMDALG